MLKFPTKGKPWTLTDAQVASWVEAYPQLNVELECRKACVWLHANPGRRKTEKGMPRFLVNWLSRAVGDARGLPGAPPPYQPWRCRHVEQCSTRAMCDNKKILGHPEPRE